MNQSIDVKLSKAEPFEESCDALVLFIAEGNKAVSDAFSSVDRKLKNALSSVLKKEQFRAKVGETIVYHINDSSACERVILTGVGKSDSLNEEIFRRAAASASQAARKAGCSIVAFVLPNPGKAGETRMAQVVSEGAILGSYRFIKFKTKEDEVEPNKKIKTIIVHARRTSPTERVLSQVKTHADATYMARDLVNEPPNSLNPEILAEIATRVAGESGLAVRVLEARELQKLRAGAILGVGSGSKVPPRLIELRYESGKKNAKKIALVGKGITFDSGGLSLKPAKAMETMKCDMAGAAAVLSAMSKLREIKPGFDVIGVLCAAENMPSGSALRPGDVVSAMNGKSIEIINTDAEGRLVLADGLSWAVRQGAQQIVDLATLTGACIIGLGPYIAGAMGNDPQFVQRIIDCGKEVGEWIWELPIPPTEYDFMVKSDIADVKNLSTNSEAGAIQGALLLREFIGNAKWVHLDIAGPAFLEKEFFYMPKNGTGFGVRTLLNYLSK